MGKQSALAVLLSVFAGASMAALPAFNDVDANANCCKVFGHLAKFGKYRRDEHCNLRNEEKTMGKQSALAVLLSVFAGASMAALPAFNDVDANGDGKITMKEASSIEGLMAAFDNADVDRDGLLSKAEYQKLKAKS